MGNHKQLVSISNWLLKQIYIFNSAIKDFSEEIIALLKLFPADKGQKLG